MPNVRLPSGGMELHNFNKDSDHPNPYAPPHALDQLFGNNYPASYPIYHHPWKDDEEMKKRGGSRMMYHNPMLNEMKEKDLSHQFMRMTWRGFWMGKKSDHYILSTFSFIILRFESEDSSRNKFFFLIFQFRLCIVLC